MPAECQAVWVLVQVPLISMAGYDLHFLSNSQRNHRHQERLACGCEGWDWGLNPFYSLSTWLRSMMWAKPLHPSVALYLAAQPSGTTNRAFWSTSRQKASLAGCGLGFWHTISFKFHVASNAPTPILIISLPKVTRSSDEQQ